MRQCEVPTVLPRQWNPTFDMHVIPDHFNTLLRAGMRRATHKSACIRAPGEVGVTGTEHKEMENGTWQRSSLGGGTCTAAGCGGRHVQLRKMGTQGQLAAGQQPHIGSPVRNELLVKHSIRYPA